MTPGLKPNFAAAAGLVDWPLLRSDQANSGYNAAESTLSATNVSQLKIAWSASVQLDPHATPILANGSLYVPCQGTAGSPNVCAIDAASGQLRWTTPVGSGEPATTVAVIAGEVFVGGQNPATMYALNASTGAVVWQTATRAAHFRGAPMVGDGVYAQADDGNLYAFSPSNGANQWTVATGGGSGTPALLFYGNYHLVIVPGFVAPSGFAAAGGQ